MLVRKIGESYAVTRRAGSGMASANHMWCQRRGFFSKFMTGSKKNDDVAFEREVDVKQALRGVLEPITKRSVTNLGSIQSVHVNTSTEKFGVRVVLDPVVPGYPHKTQLAQACSDAIRTMDWVGDVTVEYAELKTPPVISPDAPNAALAGVKHVIAVSSCKGGVGKSTVAVNLTFALASRGLKVGLLDADIYGPSLPSMVQPLDDIVHRSTKNPKFIVPLTAPMDVKMLSFGHVNPNSGVPGAGGKSPALIRGPVATRVINQLVNATEWGDLDYLIVDMPPGTGDIQITLAQSLSLSGAVIVTTPHQLALVDCAKGVAMFQEVQVPTLAVVENMSYFQCRHGEMYYPFGKGGRENVLRCLDADVECTPKCNNTDPNHKHNHNHQSDGPQSIVRSNIQSCAYHAFPLTESLACTTVTDKHVQFPVVLREPDSDLSHRYIDLANDVIAEVFKIQVGAQLIPWVGYVEGRGVVLRYFSASKAEEFFIPALELRVRDPKTGKVLPKDNKSNYSADVRPIKFEPKGNYGVAIIWSDGYSADIYPFEVLREIAQEFIK